MKDKLKLYLISQEHINGCDTIKSNCVVCARNEFHAKCMDPIGREEYKNLDDVKLRYLGDASKDIKPGFICVSFNDYLEKKE